MKRLTRILLLLALASVGKSRTAAADPPDAQQVIFFEEKVRPVLAKHCYQCHSLAEGKSKGGLTLDTLDGWKNGGESGPALVPGKPDLSRLIQAVHQADPETAMPPKEGKLSAAEIGDLEAWVLMGAPDPRTGPTSAVPAGGSMTESMKAKAASHWAFQPIRSQKLPMVKDTVWAAQPIDQFVLAKLEEQGLSPSPEADKRTLIRRASLDLTGLPPTPEEVMAFVEDDSAGAFAKVVDRLLASSQYGERWGRHWLDVARYADTRGTTRQRQTPLNPHAWTYRDYVIQSFNSDKPFNQFVLEQIAADQLPGKPDPATLAALGFLTQGDQFMGNRQDIINDQIDVVSKGFLGLTVTCARCHDHFFDPIPQADYYSLHGIFNSSEEPVENKPVVAGTGSFRHREDYQRSRDRLIEEGRRKLVAAMHRTASTFNRNAGVFFGLVGMDRKSPEFYTMLKEHQLEGRLVQELSRMMQMKLGGRRNNDALMPPVLGPLRRLMALNPDRFPQQFAVWRKQFLPSSGAGNHAVRKAFANTRPANKDEALQIFAEVFGSADEAFVREYAQWSERHRGGLFPGLQDAGLEEVRTAVVDPGVFETGSLRESPRGLPRDTQYLLNGIHAELARLDVSHPGAPGLANVLQDVAKPRNSPVYLRGQVQSPGPVVPRQFLEVLAGPDRQPFEGGSGRLGLAQAIASPQNPLTARVLVNRVWLHHFGEAFIPTPDDLGVMSGVPTHPELLDFLAEDFMRNGWSIKRLHRAILLSNTWQQSSGPDADKAAVDPFNKLLWRQNRHRLDFEALRDSILFLGGQLDLTMGGHPVNIESEPYSQRRSIYGFIDRNEMAEFMRHFDVANAALPTGRRFQTIVPQQALFRMNSLLVIEQARNIVARPDVQACATDEDRLRKLYEIIYQRWPKDQEIAAALAFLHSQSPSTGQPVIDSPANSLPDPSQMSPKQLRAYRAALARQQRQKERQQMNPRRQSAAIKEAVRDPSAEKVDRRPLTPWEMYAQALLMTNEMAYVN